MVDFQKRDTRRGLGGRDDAGDDAGDDTGDDHGHHGNEHAHDHDHEDHAHHHAGDLDEVGAAVVTVSSTRSLDDDPAGDAIVAAFEDEGNAVATRELIPDDYDEVQATVTNLVGRRDVDAVVTTGGTGVTPDDVTVEAVRPLFDKELPGFGELFRQLSRDEIGTRVVATRAVAGVVEGVPVFSLPGSRNAARLGARDVIVPEVGHLAGLARHDDADDADAG